MPQISIIIVSYNVKHYLAQCLRSVWLAAKDIKVEVFVVDNASSDGSVEYIRNLFPSKTYPQLHLLPQSDNLGFGRANNLALAQSKGEYVLFLNPDTILTSQTLQDCYAFVAQHNDAGAVGVRMLKDNGSFAPESRRSLPTPWVSLCKILSLDRLFPRNKHIGHYYADTTPEDEIAPIDIVSGAFFFVRKAILDRVGGFDEQFFMYGEDIDLAYRISLAGYQNYYLPTPILHYKGESTQRTSLRYVRHFHEAMQIFFSKHFRKSYWLTAMFVKPAIWLHAAVFYVRNLLRGVKQCFKYVPSTHTLHAIYVGNNADNLPKKPASPQLILVKYDDIKLLEIHSNAYFSKTKTCTQLIVDMSCHSYDEALQWLLASEHRQYVLFHYPEAQLLIGGGTIVSPTNS